MALPILTLPDPVTTGEGALDPLGLATIGDRLAELVLPGLRARMQRPRFLTAIAVCAGVCDGIEDQLATDGLTSPYIVFEWLLVEAFTREAERSKTMGTPGMLKAAEARKAEVPMSAKAYLRVPTVFGFHGVYKPLARNLGIVDDDLRLAENGYELLKKWQIERGLDGFVPGSTTSGPGTQFRSMLRGVVEEGLREGCVKRTSQWKGWRLLAEHLVPAELGPGEAEFIYKLLIESKGETRGEVFDLLKAAQAIDDAVESQTVKHVLLPSAGRELQARLEAIAAYETACTVLEQGFDWIRYLSSKAGARAIMPTEFASLPEAQTLAGVLDGTLRSAEAAIVVAPLSTQQEFANLSKAFDSVRSAEHLFESILNHHHDVQRAKQPDGKRDWFERSPNGETFVWVPYRLPRAPEPRDWWTRPYRVSTAQSFLSDLEASHGGSAQT
jgi:hypothetical protein